MQNLGVSLVTDDLIEKISMGYIHLNAEKKVGMGTIFSNLLLIF